ncbi:MAG: Flp family type IVb pilin [Devosia sp.]|uniref:Flp family type IVb pilin n=1 Tax=Devosia sp. TaxID=1871048 RepID=UPI001AC4E12D|nr:Flp family type IVb pilin [Devosia sp.]MBN9308835.1 Flp family type IVb pilin [Devosia sp.]MBN9318054.1 Flp family type IVb pilin [Devosia sp.]
MSRVQVQLSRFAANENGATAIEYGLIAGLIAVGILVAMSSLGGGVSAMFEYVSSRAGQELDNGNGL